MAPILLVLLRVRNQVQNIRYFPGRSAYAPCARCMSTPLSLSLSLSVSVSVSLSLSVSERGSVSQLCTVISCTYTPLQYPDPWTPRLGARTSRLLDYTVIVVSRCSMPGVPSIPCWPSSSCTASVTVSQSDES